MLPLFEAKMIHLYDARWATYEPDGSVRDVTLAEKADPNFFVMPGYWVHQSAVDKKLAGKWDKPWFLCWRDITNSTNERTTVVTKLPRVAAGNNLPIALPAVTNDEASALQAALSSFVLDFTSRLKAGGTHMNFFIFMQLPVPIPELLRPYLGWIAERVDRLNSQRLDADTNAATRAELDALMFHIYGVVRDDVDYIMEAFPIVRRKDIAAYGKYRTKHLILDAYDRLANGVPHGDATHA